MYSMSIIVQSYDVKLSSRVIVYSTDLVLYISYKPCIDAVCLHVEFTAIYIIIHVV